MTEYTVKWQIEVTADNPTEAAMQARMFLLDPESEAVHYEVATYADWEENARAGTVSYEDVDLSDVDFTKVEV